MDLRHYEGGTNWVKTVNTFSKGVKQGEIGSKQAHIMAETMSKQGQPE